MRTLGGLVILLVLALSVSALAGTSDQNHPEYWGDTCYKIDEAPGGSSWTADQDYLLVVLKAGTENHQFHNVLEGQTLTTPTGKDISHLILCLPPSVTTTTPSSTVTSLSTTTTLQTTTTLDSTTTTEPQTTSSSEPPTTTTTQETSTTTSTQPSTSTSQPTTTTEATETSTSTTTIPATTTTPHVDATTIPSTTPPTTDPPLQLPLTGAVGMVQLSALALLFLATGATLLSLRKRSKS